MDLLEKHLPKYDNNEKNWIYSENLYLYNKYTQAFDIKSVLKQDDIKLINLINIKPKVDKKNKKNPYDIIIEMTENNNIYIDYIKTELNNFISTKDFQKVFGIKKNIRNYVRINK